MSSKRRYVVTVSMVFGLLMASSPSRGDVLKIIDSQEYYPAFNEIFDRCEKSDFADDNYDQLKSLFNDSTGLISNLKSFSQLFIHCLSKAESHREDARKFFQGLVGSPELFRWGYDGLLRIGETEDIDFIIADSTRQNDRRSFAYSVLSRSRHPHIPPFFFDAFRLEQDPLRRSDLLSMLATTGSSMAVTAARIDLSHPEPSNRIQSARFLAMFEDKDSVPILVTKLDDPIDSVRSAVVDSLGLIGDPAPVEAIRRLRTDPSSAVRERVISSLCRLGSATDDDFRLALQDQDPRVRETARLIYDNTGQGMDTEFVIISKSSDPQARADAAIQLGRIWGEQADARLKELVRDENPRVQFFAATALWANGHPDGEAILRKMLEGTSDEDVLVEIASAFARTGKEKSLSALERIYHSDWAPTARSNAAIMFSGIGEAASLVTIKAWLLLERDPAVKRTLAEIAEGKYN